MFKAKTLVVQQWHDDRAHAGVSYFLSMADRDEFVKNFTDEFLGPYGEAKEEEVSNDLYLTVVRDMEFWNEKTCWFLGRS